MKYKVRLSGIEKQLRDSFSIPASFLAFAESAKALKYGSVGFFSIGYVNPAPIANLRPEAREFLTTIMSLGDGSLVGLWFEESRKPLVVGLGSEGQHSVIANSLPEFLARIRNSTTGFEDLDARDENEESSFPRIRGVPLKVTATKRANTRFAKWLSSMERTVKFASAASGTRISERLVEILGPHMDEDDFSSWQLRQVIR